MDRCREKNVNRIFMPNIDDTTIEDMLAVEASYPEMCIPMMGLHPAYVGEGYEKALSVIESWLAKRAFAAVGEIGMDLYWDKTFKEAQKEVFRYQIDLAKKYNLPIVIHNREAFEETISIVEEKKDENLSGIFHCFTGGVDEARRIMDLDFYIGLGGVTTFKNAGMDKVVPYIDSQYILLETDSPFLAPVPWRGKRNEPSYIPLIAQKIADYKQMKVEDLAEVTTKNALDIYQRINVD